MTEGQPRRKPAGSGKPRSGKPGDKPRTGKPGEKPRSGKPGDKPRSGKPGDKPRSGKPGDKPRSGKPGGRSGDKPRGGKPGDRPRSAGPRTSKPGEREERPARSMSARPSSDRPRSERSSSDRPRTDRPSSDRSRSDRPSSDRPRSGRPPAGRTSSGQSRKPGAARSRPDGRPDTRRPQRASADRPRDPHIPDDITPEMLDKGLLFELRTLPEGLAEIVARHLVAADNALVEGDVTLARAHIAAAKRRAGRVAPVREAAGIAAYMDGDFAEAIAELRTVRRMTGGDEYVPMLADCERGLGRPQRALELIKEVDQRTVDAATRVELTLVAAGARADMGQIDAALVVLQIPELTKLPKGGPRARLQYAYADLLEQAGRIEESRTWMRKAAASDIDGVTDAEERVEEEAGLAFIEEEYALESDDAEPAPPASD